MQLTISLAVFLAIIMFLLIKKSGLKAGHAIVCTLFGFYLASSGLAPQIQTLVNSLVSTISGLRF